MRTFIVIALLVTGGVLSVVANLSIWLQRTVMDEDAFVSTVDRVFEDEAVQTALAEGLTDEVMELADIEGRIRQVLGEIEGRTERDLPEGLVLLAVPLSSAIRGSVYQVVLRVVEAERLADVRDAALRGMHRVLVAIIKNDRRVLEIEGDQVVLNLRSVVEESIKATGGERGEELLARIDIPEDAGKVVLTEKSNLGEVRSLARGLRYLLRYATAITVAALTLAVVISRSRRRMAIAVGATLAVSGALTLVALESAGGLITDAISDPEANTIVGAMYDSLMLNFKNQSAFLVMGGVVLLGGAVLAGDPDLATAVRSRFGLPVPGTAAPREVSLTAWARERAQALRVGGLGTGGLLLIVWPEPTTRVYITVLLVVALYLAALAIASSDAQWAVSARSWLGGLCERYFRAETAATSDETRMGSVARWVAARASWLRAIGIAAGIVLLVAWPSLTFGVFVVVAALELLYLAAVDMVVSRLSD